MSRMSEMSHAMQDYCNENFGPEDIPAPEVWVDCSECGGEGAIETPRPFHDDPYFCIVSPCNACHGAGGMICEAEGDR